SQNIIKNTRSDLTRSIPIGVGTINESVVQRENNPASSTRKRRLQEPSTKKHGGSLLVAPDFRIDFLNTPPLPPPTTGPHPSSDSSY
ncbi:hypothetical protein HN011_002182, partial [Eciton burchellii]